VKLRKFEPVLRTLKELKGNSRNTEVESPFVSFTELLTGAFLILILIVAALALNVNDNRARCDDSNQEVTDRYDSNSILVEKFSTELNENGVPAEFNCQGQSVILPDGLVFSAGSANLNTPEQVKVIEVLAKSLSELLTCNAAGPDCSSITGLDTILIEGHADRTASAETNWMLSFRRAYSVYNEVIEQQPVLLEQIPDEFRNAGDGVWIAVAAYGETRPRVATKDGVRNAENRRIEIRFLFGR
jgi:outer membrane protein OmpA-like peptidoglycan-associated protein